MWPDFRNGWDSSSDKPDPVTYSMQWRQLKITRTLPNHYASLSRGVRKRIKGRIGKRINERVGRRIGRDESGIRPTPNPRARRIHPLPPVRIQRVQKVSPELCPENRDLRTKAKRPRKSRRRRMTSRKSQRRSRKLWRSSRST